MDTIGPYSNKAIEREGDFVCLCIKYGTDHSEHTLLHNKDLIIGSNSILKRWVTRVTLRPIGDGTMVEVCVEYTSTFPFRSGHITRSCPNSGDIHYFDHFDFRNQLYIFHNTSKVSCP